MSDANEPLAAVPRLLAEHGPLHADEITQRLRDMGEPVPERVVDEISYPVGQLTEDRWVWLPAVLSGRVFTHRLSEDELTHDVLLVTPDLDPVTELCHHEQYQRFADGSQALLAIEAYDDELLEERDIPPELVGEGGGLLLTPGTLAGLDVAEGDLVGIRLTPDGLALERVDAAGSSDVGERLAALLDADQPEFIDVATWTLCGNDPALFTEPLAPLSEIVDGHGLARQGEEVAPAGFDFDSWRFELRCELLAQRHGIDPDDAFALNTLVNLHEQFERLLELTGTGDEPPDELPAPRGDDEYSELIGQVGAEFADPVMAGLLLEETIGDGSAGAAALGLLAETLEPQVPRAARVAFRWLRGIALERIGDIEGAERELLDAESLDPSWPWTLVDLARFASDRGDAERALALLRRAGADDHPLAHMLGRYRVDERRDIGRNDPCWCGSGRKYKKCHLGHEQLALAERASWLYQKACQYVLLSDWNGHHASAAYERIRGGDVTPETLQEAMADPLPMDAVLFEGGAFEEFLAVRGALLPDDERALAEQWLLVDRSVFEVEQVHRGQGMTVRDIRTGDRHDVRERLASTQLKPGQLICARVLPAGDTMQFLGGIEPVALHERDPLIALLDSEPDELTLVAQLSGRFTPPTLTNTEGDPLLFCEAVVRFGDPAALDDSYQRLDEDGPPRWHEHVPGRPQIRASLSLDGELLRVETNSAERMDRVLAELVRLDPALTILEDIRRTPDEIDTSDIDTGTIDSDDPEIVALLEHYIRAYETQWLDEPIPALNGHTPRQAADDPTRRGDLIKLLDTFPAEPGGMDAGRLRTALGLE